MRDVPEFVERQLRRPSGLLGYLVGRLMSRSNVYEAEWTVAELDVQPTDRVLEIGFGPGVAVDLAARRATRGLVAGVDVSATMVRAARRRNAAAIRSGRVELREGDVAHLPFESGHFDKALSIHCLYFWPEPLAGLGELQRVLRPGGCLALTITPRGQTAADHPPTAAIFRHYDPAEVCELLGEAGFAAAQVRISPDPTKFPGVVVMGQKRG